MESSAGIDEPGRRRIPSIALAPDLREKMLALVPSLRAFAMSLTRNIDGADDLVQETLLRALANIDKFEPGTNISAWLITILRNVFYSEWHKRLREVEDRDGSYTESLASHPEQHGRMAVHLAPRLPNYH